MAESDVTESQLIRIVMCRWVIMLLMLAVSHPAKSGAFEFAGDANGVDIVSHPAGYTGTGGNLIVTVGISPASLYADEMLIPVQNAVKTWNRQISTIGNVIADSNQILHEQFDFESVALHELGHCIGLAHPNLASESGLTGANKNYTSTTKGINNQFDLNSGADGIIGSSDDVRGDDVNLHWFRRESNNPFIIAGLQDITTYSRNLADLPLGDLFVANGDRGVSALFGMQNTEAVMQQGISPRETKRSLTADDVATLRLAMSGLDMIAGTADDYTLTLVFNGFTDTADIVFNFDNMASFSACSISGIFLNETHVGITEAHISFNADFSWFFNDKIIPHSKIPSLPLGSINPVMSISASGLVDDDLVFKQEDRLSLVVALNPGSSVGSLADHWVWANTPLGTFWLNGELQFIRSDSPIRVFGGPLNYISPFTILNIAVSELPSGTYTVFFAVDGNQDNIIDATFQDMTTFIID
ncbi:hypothetical protein [Nitrosomonas cryotolerans]|nr:hypothetical protein [Nitrosomonas cryotolerans]